MFGQNPPCIKTPRPFPFFINIVANTQPRMKIINIQTYTNVIIPISKIAPKSDLANFKKINMGKVTLNINLIECLMNFS